MSAKFDIYEQFYVMKCPIFHPKYLKFALFLAKIWSLFRGKIPLSWLQWDCWNAYLDNLVKGSWFMILFSTLPVILSRYWQCKFSVQRVLLLFLIIIGFILKQFILNIFDWYCPTSCHSTHVLSWCPSKSFLCPHSHLTSS